MGSSKWANCRDTAAEVDAVYREVLEPCTVSEGHPPQVAPTHTHRHSARRVAQIPVEKACQTVVRPGEQLVCPDVEGKEQVQEAG